MPLKSKAQERFLWAKHPDVAQKFEDETPKKEKANLPQHVKKMASGGVVDPDSAVNDYIMSEFNPKPLTGLTPGLTTQGLLSGGALPETPSKPSETPPSTPPETPATENVPRGTNETTEKVTTSNPGHSQEALQDWIQGQERQLDEYGPEKEKEAVQNALESENSLGSKLGRAGAAFSDALMQGVAEAGNPGNLQNIENEQQKRAEMQANLIPTLANMNTAQMSAKQKLQEFDPQSPLSQVAQKTYAPLFQKLGYPPEKLKSMSASDIKTALSLMTDYGGKEVEAKIKEFEISINAQRAAAEIANQEKQRELQEKGLKMNAAEKVASGSSIPFVGPTHTQKQAAIKTLANISGTASDGTSGFLKTATNPKTGQRIGWDGKKWMPIQ